MFVTAYDVRAMFGQVKVWFQNRRMKFKRQSRGHVSVDGRSNVDVSPRRSLDDDDDDDVECVDEQRRTHGTSTVTSRSASPAVDSTTTDYCSLVVGDTRTTADRSNESLLLSSQRTSLDNDEPTPARCSDDDALRRDVSCLGDHERVGGVADQPATDFSADDANRISGAASQTSVVAAVDAVDISGATPSQTENNLARLEIMTCIAGGNVDQRQNAADLRTDSTLRPRCGQDGQAGALSRSSRPAVGRRARATQSRTRNGALNAACAGGVTFDTAALSSSYRHASVFEGDANVKNYVGDLRRESRDISRDLESTVAFPGGTYSGTARCAYADLTADVLFPPGSYRTSAVTDQHQMSQSYGVPADNHFQSALVGRPPSSPALHCNVRAVRNNSDSFTALSLPPPHSASSFPVCDAGWPTWKDWRWNDCASFSESAVDYDEEYFLAGGERVSWRSAVDTRGWSNGGRDAAASDFTRTSFQGTNAARRCQLSTCWSGDYSAVYPCAANFEESYHDGRGDTARSGSYCMPPTSSSRFYDGDCCYSPTSSSLSAIAAADGPEPMRRQSAYQSCKYSGVVDSHCRLYTPDDNGCLPPPFVNKA